MYVHAFLSPRIFTFLLCNSSTVYYFVKKTLLLVTVNVFVSVSMCACAVYVCMQVGKHQCCEDKYEVKGCQKKSREIKNH